jgi:hypothetical protein
MNEVQTFDFHGDHLPIVRRDDDCFMPLKPMADALGLDARAQQRMIERSPWSETCTAVMAAQLPSDSQIRQHFMISHRIVPMWIANITARRIKDEAVKAKVIKWQKEFADALFKYVFEGGAINPRATEDQLTAIIGRAEQQMRVLRLADGLVERAWLEAKARHVAARALGEEPEVDPATRPLTVGEYLADRGVTGAALRSLSSNFGKQVKALYRLKYETEPQKVERFVDGALRMVAGYTERDRPLFDAAWNRLNA